MGREVGSALMLTLLFIGMLTLALDVGGAQPLATEWTRTYGRAYWDLNPSVVQTSDGGYALAGDTSNTFEPEDAWLVKTDSEGNEEWNRTYGGAGREWVRSIAQTPDGGYAVAGNSNSSGAGDWDFWLVKTDSEGNEEWNRTYGGASYEDLGALVTTADGGYALAGTTYSFGRGLDAWLVKTDSNGNEEWNRTYGGFSTDYAESAVQTNDGGYALAGSTYSFGGWNAEFWLVKTDSDGNVEWHRTYDENVGDRTESVVQTSDGGYVLVGYTYPTYPSVLKADLAIIKVDSSGNMQWNETWGGLEHDYAWSVVEMYDGGYAVVGETWSFGPLGQCDAFLVKFGASGNIMWIETYGEAGDDFAYSLIKTSDGGLAFAGDTSSFGVTGYDFWLVKIVGPPEHTLTISSSPSGVTFTADGVPHTTPWTATYFDGTSVDVRMPPTQNGYRWSHWSDTNTSRLRTVIVDTDITLTGIYEPMPLHPAVGGKATAIPLSANKLGLLAHYVGLTILLTVAVGTVVYVKKRKSSHVNRY